MTKKEKYEFLRTMYDKSGAFMNDRNAQLVTKLASQIGVSIATRCMMRGIIPHGPALMDFMTNIGINLFSTTVGYAAGQMTEEGMKLLGEALENAKTLTEDALKSLEAEGLEALENQQLFRN